MKKKLCVLLLTMITALPACYASFFSFSEPSVSLNAPKGIGYGARPNREAYKPYPAPRGEVPVNQYALERKKHLAEIDDSFRSVDSEYGEALKAADLAVRDFDALTAGSLK
jgi:hypothetical protein